MATIINPITTVLLNRTEFESGEFDRFPFKYILESDGTITYNTKLSAGRYILSKEAQIKGLGTNPKVAAPKAEFQPLAYGNKIPGDFFYQIRQFFLDVMSMGASGKYEAQTFIVWNETRKDYRIIIPEQKVSAAAVSYDIQDLLAEDDIIICDIHSHNDMGAFFSGTDDRDDRKNPWISGVFGKLSTQMENKFRFNDGSGRHFEMKAEDVFDFEDARFQTPKEWLAQVTISTPARTQVSKVRSYGQAYSHVAGWPDAEEESFYSPSEFGMGRGNTWLDELFNPEDDLYDVAVDALSVLTEESSRRVLESLEDSIVNPGENVDLDESEMAAYLEVHHKATELKDPKLFRDVVTSLLKAY